MKVLSLPTILSSIGDVMIRDDYDEAMKDIERHHTIKIRNRGVVVVGHPGIGKSMGSVGQALVLVILRLI